MDEDNINDVRTDKEFKGVAFSKFKKTDVKKELIQSLYNSKIEPACYWSAELVCAGHFIDLWEIIISFFSKHIHTGHPILVSYLDMRIVHFKELVTNGYSDQELRLRNNVKIRKLFCEVMCVLCESRKKHCRTEVKVKRTDFDLTQMSERFKAPSVSFAEQIFREGDPNELFIVANELAYSITVDCKNSVNACYWFEWLIEFEKICKKRGEFWICERRMFADVEPVYQKDLIWIVWEIFINESTKRSLLVKRLIESTLNLFCLKYTPGCYRKRRLLIYFAIEILTERYDVELDIVKDKDKLNIISSNVNSIYRQIKLNEISPGMDYLYQNMKATNLEHTIAKLETMKQLGAEYIPRTVDS